MARLLFLYFLALLSGAAALSHELLWTRRLIDLLGATPGVTGRVVGVFFLGISLGGWLATRWTRSSGSAIGRLVWAELLIGLLTLPAAFLPAWTDWIWPTIGSEALIAWGVWVKLTLAVIVILPPSMMMGTTLPFFIRAATDWRGSVSRSGIWIYSLNTLGGVGGLWVASNFLLESLGVQAAMLSVTAVNFLVALGAYQLYRSANGLLCEQSDSAQQEKSVRQEKPIHQLEATSEQGHALSWPSLLGLAFISGVIVLAFEVLIFRLVGLVVPSSFQTTSALLANVILFLVIGSSLVGWLNHWSVSNRWLIAAGLVGACLFSLFCPFVLYAQTGELISVRYLAALNNQTIDSMSQYWWIVFKLIAVATGGTLLCAGLVFPALISLSSQNDAAGKSIGYLLAANGLGGLLGSEMSHSFLLSQFGIYGSLCVVAGLAGLVAAVLLFKLNQHLFWLWLVVGIPLLIWGQAKVVMLPYVSPHLTKKYQVESTRFGHDGVLLVTQDQKKSRSLLLNNQYILGSSGAAAVAEQRQLRLPWILHPDSKQVCCLGFATGITAGGLETLPDPPAVTAVEISELVAQAAEQDFQEENQSFVQRPGNRLVLEDARTYIASATDQFDLIVADLFRPHGVGEGRLFAREHFLNVRRALKSDGLFCQWLPAHQLNQKNFEMIAATFRQVFPQTLVVNCGQSTKTPVIGLLGWKDDRAWSGVDLKQKIQIAEKQQLFPDDPLLSQAYFLIVGELKPEAFADSPLNTLDNALIEIQAGRFWVLKDLRRNRKSGNLKNEFLSGKHWLDFNLQLHAQTDPVWDVQYRKQFLQILQTQLPKKK